jgi:hypothetical protein
MALEITSVIWEEEIWNPDGTDIEYDPSSKI